MAEMTHTKENPAAVYEQGYLPCTACAQYVAFGDCAPLGSATCPTCGTANVVPLCIRGFWLYTPLALGGMGAVYKACRVEHPGEFYAVKILPRQDRDNPTLVQNMQREIEVNREIGDHPCKVEVIDSGQDADEYFIASRYVSGEGLDARVLRTGGLPETEILLIALRLLALEAHVYDRGYLYRDLKLENIIISPQHGAFLCDFGICLPIDEAVGMSDQDKLQGSPLYIPPERLLDEGEDVYSEIYSLGLVLYHAMMGKPFYEADEVSTVARMHIEAPTAGDQEQKLAAIPEDMRNVLRKMIERNPADRYQSFVEVEAEAFTLLYRRLTAGRGA